MRAHEVVERARALAAAEHEQQRPRRIEAELRSLLGRLGVAGRLGEVLRSQRRPQDTVLCVAGTTGRRVRPRVEDARGERRQRAGRPTRGRVDLQHTDRDAERARRERRGQAGEAAEAQQHARTRALESPPGAQRLRREPQRDTRQRRCAAAGRLERELHALELDVTQLLGRAREDLLLDGAAGQEPDDPCGREARTVEVREQVQARHDVTTRPTAGQRNRDRALAPALHTRHIPSPWRGARTVPSRAMRGRLSKASRGCAFALTSPFDPEAARP